MRKLDIKIRSGRLLYCLLKLTVSLTIALIWTTDVENTQILEDAFKMKYRRKHFLAIRVVVGGPVVYGIEKSPRDP